MKAYGAKRYDKLTCKYGCCRIVRGLKQFSSYRKKTERNKANKISEEQQNG